MSNVNVWWEGLSLSLKIYWGFALPFTLFFALQLIVSFFGGESDHDSANPDTDISHDGGAPFQFFTLKNMITFFTIFGWAGIAALELGLGEGGALVAAIVSGLLMMTIMATLFYVLSKATASGTMKFENAVGAAGQVYLTISGKRSGTGQVQVKVQGSLRTLEAMTDDEQDIPTGRMITVKSIINDRILLVSAL